VGIELFERAIQGGGQLLRAEVSPLGETRDRVSVLLLTFDLGRMVVTAEPATESLLVEYVESPDHTPAGAVDASEEEPWWRVLGSPIARAWPAGPSEGSVCLQFRADDQSPRVITLEPRGGCVTIRLENSPPAG
jgi:hypothetical protein